MNSIFENSYDIFEKLFTNVIQTFHLRNIFDQQPHLAITLIFSEFLKHLSVQIISRLSHARVI